MLKKILFQTHWLLGISAGLVLALMGATGALLSFEPELLRWSNARVLKVSARAEPPLDTPQLLARLQADQPQRPITGLTLWREPGASARVVFAAPSDRRGEPLYADPYTARLLGAARGESFFRFVEDVHRRLGAGPAGRSVTGAAACCLVLMCLTGLALRWPRCAGDWRAWLYLDTRLRGRGFLRALHSVAGTWALMFALVAALTGLFFAYDWYRAGVHRLTGTPLPQREAGGATAPAPGPLPPGLEPGWAGFVAAAPRWRQVTLRLPQRAGQPLQISYLDHDAPHDRAFSRLRIDAASGEAQQHERHAHKAAGAQLVAGMLPLHTGSYFGLPGRLLMFAAALAMALFAVTGWILYLGRRSRLRAAPRRQRRTDVARQIDPDEVTARAGGDRGCSS